MMSPCMYRMYGEGAVKHWLQGDKNEKGYVGNGALHNLIDMLYEDHQRFGVEIWGACGLTRTWLGQERARRRRVALENYDVKGQIYYYAGRHIRPHMVRWRH